MEESKKLELAQAAAPLRHQSTRRRHELKRRRVTVGRVETLTPRMRRIEFTSPDLGDFVSLSPDDHVKIFFPDGDSPAMRDFTPRRFDNGASTLIIDFALHEAGPAAEWAAQATVGDDIEIGGPRGSHVIPDDFDWYLLVADESALPAMGRWLEELRAEVPVTTIALIADEGEVQSIDTKAVWSPSWLFRGDAHERDAELVREALQKFEAPSGDGFVWIAGEASLARAARGYVLDVLHHPRPWMKASGYWQRGDRGRHVELDDDGSHSGHGHR